MPECCPVVPGEGIRSDTTSNGQLAPDLAQGARKPSETRDFQPPGFLVGKDCKGQEAGREM